MVCWAFRATTSTSISLNRIAQGVWPDEVREADFFTPQGQYKIDDGATKTMRESLMYKMSYYRFNDLFGGRRAWIG